MFDLWKYERGLLSDESESSSSFTNDLDSEMALQDAMIHGGEDDEMVFDEESPPLRQVEEEKVPLEDGGSSLNTSGSSQ